MTHVKMSARILVPFIVSGLSIFAVLVYAHILPRLFDLPHDPELRLFLLCLLVGSITFLASLFSLRWITGPLFRFFRKAEDLGVLPAKHSAEETHNKTDPEIWESMLLQVTDVLSTLDASAMFPEIICQSRSMREVLTQTAQVARTDSSVLITGESGTGKELIASGIHKCSARAKGPFLAINCAAIPSQLLESELFGYERGAFTGAGSAKPGKFELATNGTLFLDEIGDMPLETQAKILRTLETGEISRLGSTSTRHCDVRIISATNADLPKKVEEKTFREDLFHRLNVFPLALPPLRQRKEDIPALVDHFRNTLGHKSPCPPEMLQIFLAQDWPGNVRELKNHVERSLVLEDAQRLTPKHEDHVPDSPVQENTAPRAEQVSEPEHNDLDSSLAAIEYKMICAALKRTEGVQNSAAELLGIKPRSLWHRIKKYEIDVTKYKTAQHH